MLYVGDVRGNGRTIETYVFAKTYGNCKFCDIDDNTCDCGLLLIDFVYSHVVIDDCNYCRMVCILYHRG